MSGRERAAVVVIGGGVLGCSVAWHLARAGQTDVIVLERNDVGSGATARSAGLVARGRLHRETLQFVARTREAMAELEAELGQPVGFHRVGSVRLAASEARENDLIAMDALLLEHDVAVQNIDAAKAASLVPWLDASSARRISYVEDDGYIDGYALASAYASAARARGVRIRPRTEVRRILHDGARVTGVQTDRGDIDADAIVDAAGAWGISIASGIGVPVGAAAVRSHYFITAPQPGAARDHPIVYLPDARAYARPEVGGLLLGVQEPGSRTYDARELPANIADFPHVDDGGDWSVLLEHSETLSAYIPRLHELPLAHHITGPSTYTPDGRFIVGRAGTIDGFFVAGGCCGTGLSASGGIGEAVASLVVGAEPRVDLAAFDPHRFGAIDPFDLAFRERCAAARAGKSRR